jgi:hypothetical protein
MTCNAVTHRPSSLAWLLIFILGVHGVASAQPTSDAASAFDSYRRAVEVRLVQQHQSTGNFLAPVSSDWKMSRQELRQGKLIIEKLTPETGSEVSGALLHHWRATAFIQGGKAEDFERLLQDFDAYPRYFAPQVLQARTISRNGGSVRAWMRVRQKHGIAVVLDATYNVTFDRLDISHRYSASRSEHIDEVEHAGTNSEHALTANEEHGFLWKLNSYWSYEEQDGGLYLQVEAISLTRSIPTGLGWAVRPYVESIPRESLAFTLRSACDSLAK